jgi:alpha-L-fucosidase
MDTRSDDQLWADLGRPLPNWFTEAKLGIFIHWGAYSVPAWAEPTGALGTVPDDEWFTHNAYAEWYFNTIRIPGSPAAQHHRQNYHGAPYDDFLDAWKAEQFDPTAWAELFAAAGASYVIPTTKHHDGIALWDAPATGTRNTVHRGPRRDLVGAVADAVRAAGMHFGVYYSGGLDWNVSDYPPLMSGEEVSTVRPKDPAYNAYAMLHVRDLIERYHPDVLWNDINWPDAGKRAGSWSLHELFEDFYAGNPDGVINDRWGIPFADYLTSEYEAGLDKEGDQAWENCRGLGFSFGYNQVEDERQVLSGAKLARHLADVVSRGGRLLLNVGPTAAGEIPAIQQASLRSLGRWTRPLTDVLRTGRPVPPEIASSSDQPWVRWLETPDHLVALVDQTGEIGLEHRHPTVDDAAAELVGSGQVEGVAGGRMRVRLTELPDGPAAVLIPKR